MLVILVTAVLTSCDPPPFEYKVHVQTDGTGEPIVNAEVTVAGAGSTKTALTDNNGNASIYIDAEFVGQPGKLTVSVDGYKPYDLNVELTEKNLPQDVALELATFEYQVHIEVSGTGEPIANAQVTISGAGATKKALTDDLGNASIFIDANLIGKKGKLEVHTDGFEPYSQQIDLIESILPTEIALTPISFTYQVLVSDDKSGDPVKNAMVSIRPDREGIGISEETDNNGIVTFEVGAALVGKLGKLSVQANGFEPYTENITISSGELPGFVRLVPSGVGPLLIADFDNCSNVNNLGGGMGGAYNAPDSLIESYIQETGKGCVAKLKFNIGEWAAFWLQLKAADFTPYNTLSFDIRSDANFNVPGQIQLELKRPGGELEIFVISNITTAWTTITVNLSDFGPANFGNSLSSFTGMSELVFTFTTQLSGNEGLVFLDNIILKP